MDGWDLIQRPFQASGAMDSRLQGSEMAPNMVMPPTPSDADDVIKHWEKANFSRLSSPQTNPLSPYLRPPIPQNLSRHLANIGPLSQTAYAAADKWFNKWRGN